MARKRKCAFIDDLFNDEPKCIGPWRNCPYARRRPLRSKMRKISMPILEIDSCGSILFDDGPKSLTERYELTALIGRGGFGVVARANDKETSRIVAVKIIENSHDSHMDGVQEALLLKKLTELDAKDQYHCARLLDAFCYGGHVCLVFNEYGETVNKFRTLIRCRPYSLDEVRHIGYQLCCAIKFLHENRLTHNDVKPENVVFENRTLNAASIFGKDSFDIRLIDFGSVTKPHETRNVARTSFYSPPEYILENQSTYGYDIWSIGCTLFELYIGEMLFCATTHIEHLALIEQKCGKLPRHLMSVSPRTFKANGTIRIDGRTRAGRKVRSSLNLEAHQRSNRTEEREFFKLLKTLLNTDAQTRPNIEDVFKCEFFERYTRNDIQTELRDDGARFTDSSCIFN